MFAFKCSGSLTSTFCMSSALAASRHQRRSVNSKLFTHSLKHSGILHVQTGNMKKCWFLFFSQEVILWLPVVPKFWSPSTLYWHLTAPLNQVQTLETNQRNRCPFASPPRMLCNLKANSAQRTKPLTFILQEWEKTNKAAQRTASCLDRSKEEQSYLIFNVLNKFCISGLFQWLSSPWRGNKGTLVIDS